MEVGTLEFFVPERKQRIKAALLASTGIFFLILAFDIYSCSTRGDSRSLSVVAGMNLLVILHCWRVFRNPYVSVSPDGVRYWNLYQWRRFLPADKISSISWSGDNIGVKLHDNSVVSILSGALTKEQRKEVTAAIQELIDSRKRSNDLRSAV